MIYTKRFSSPNGSLNTEPMYQKAYAWLAREIERGSTHIATEWGAFYGIEEIEFTMESATGI